jgi:hypothetical protein
LFSQCHFHSLVLFWVAVVSKMHVSHKNFKIDRYQWFRLVKYMLGIWLWRFLLCQLQDCSDFSVKCHCGRPGVPASQLENTDSWLRTEVSLCSLCR